MKIFITGVAGFLGSHFVEELLVNTDWNIVCLCRLTYVGDLERLLESLHVREHADRIKLTRLSAHAIEAAEQCGGTYIPKIEELQKINEVLENFPPDRSLLFCDAKLQASGINFENLKKGKWAILVGPEGGFSEIERNYLKGLKFTFSITENIRVRRPS